MNIRLYHKVAKGLAVAVAACGVVSSTFGETYWLAGSDGYDSSSMLANSGAGWKTASGTIVKHAPAVGNTYMIEGTSESYPTLRTPPRANSATFAPELIVRNGLISLKLNNNGTLTLSDCLVEKGILQLDPGDQNRRYTLGGQMQVAADGILQPRPLQQNSGADMRAVNIGNTIMGSGLIHVVLYPGLTIGTSRTTDVTVNGDLSRFVGKMKVEDPYKIASSVQMIFSAATAFPGAMPEKTTDGFVLAGGAKLVFNASGSFDFNRGFVFGVAANDPMPEIVVAANQEVVIDGPVSGMVGFTKTGPGKLTISKRSADLTGLVTVKEGTLVIAGLPNATVMHEGDGKIEYVGGSETIGVTTTNYQGYEDDDYHGIIVTIDRQEGVDYKQEWSEDGESFGPTEPKYQQAGEHTVWCRVSAEGYDPVTVSGKVLILLRTIVASMTAEKIETADGQPHALPEWTVSDPAEGYSLNWSVNGVSHGSVAPTFSVADAYAATCTITAPHYETRTISGTLYLRSSDDIYVDSASTSGIPPYDAPEKAMGDLGTALKIVCDGGTVHLASGAYGLGHALKIDRTVTVEGPADRSAIVTRNGFDVSAGSVLSGVTFDALVSRALMLRQSSTASNVCVRGCTNPVYSDGGTLTDSVISNFTGHYAFKAATSVSCLTRIQASAGWLEETGEHTAPIIVGTSTGTRDAATLSMVDCEVFGNTNRVGPISAGFLACGGDSKMYVSMLRCRVLHNSGRSAIFRGGSNGAAGNYIAVTNCLFVDNSSRNTAFGSGVAASAVWMRGEFVNCTFTRNLSLAGDPQLGLFVCPTGASVALKNCIVSDNDLVTYYNGYGPDSSLQITTSMFPECGADDPSGNIAGPAVFRGRGEAPYALKFVSPGIGAGDVLGWANKDTDLAGKRRMQGGLVDMGCYQSGGSGMMIFVQ